MFYLDQTCIYIPLHPYCVEYIFLKIEIKRVVAAIRLPLKHARKKRAGTWGIGLVCGTRVSLTSPRGSLFRESSNTLSTAQGLFRSTSAPPHPLSQRCETFPVGRVDGSATTVDPCWEKLCDISEVREGYR